MKKSLFLTIAEKRQRTETANFGGKIEIELLSVYYRNKRLHVLNLAAGSLKAAKL